MFILEAIWVLL